MCFSLPVEMATHSSTLAWKIPWMEEPGRLQSMGSQRVGHNWATSLSLSEWNHSLNLWLSLRSQSFSVPELIFHSVCPLLDKNKRLMEASWWERLTEGKLGLLWWAGLCSVQFSWQLCPTLCDPMDCSMPGIPVHHQLPELAQTHVHQVGDAIQPYHLLSSPSPPAFNLSQHQSLFQWVSYSHQVAKGLEFQLQHQSFQWRFRTDFL